jgi:hypothetical protein
MMNSACIHRTLLGCLVPLLACSAAMANADAAGRPPARDPMLAPAEARPAAAAAATPASAAAPAPARHLMVIDGRRYVVWGGRKRGVGDLLGDARIERIEDTAVVVRQDGALRRLPLYGDVQRRPAPESAAPLALPAGANAIQRPIRPSDAGALSLARPESPSRPGARLDPSYRAGDPQ